MTELSLLLLGWSCEDNDLKYFFKHMIHSNNKKLWPVLYFKILCTTTQVYFTLMRKLRWLNTECKLVNL